MGISKDGQHGFDSIGDSISVVYLATIEGLRLQDASSSKFEHAVSQARPLIYPEVAYCRVIYHFRTSAMDLRLEAQGSEFRLDL